MESRPLAYRDVAFLDTDEARPLRILAEYLGPLRAFQQARIHDTVAFFGSARIQPEGPLGRYFQDARQLARRVTEWGQSMPADGHQLTVCTGGGGGIMEAANLGASEASGPSIGLNIGLPTEQRPNPHITPELSFEFRYFFMRKLWFAHLARAVVVFPGGFGTLDELFEVLTLSQTGKLGHPIFVLLYGRDYWQQVVNFDALADHGVIARGDLERFRYADEPEAALRLLKDNVVLSPDGRCPALARSVTCSSVPTPDSETRSHC